MDIKKLAALSSRFVAKSYVCMLLFKFHVYLFWGNVSKNSIYIWLMGRPHDVTGPHMNMIFQEFWSLYILLVSWCLLLHFLWVLRLLLCWIIIILIINHLNCEYHQLLHLSSLHFHAPLSSLPFSIFIVFVSVTFVALCVAIGSMWLSRC